MLQYITWNVSPEIFQIGTFAVRWYGLLFALAFIAGQRIMVKIYEQEGKTEKDVDSLTFYMIIGTVLGARLGHVLFYQPDYYLSNPIEILKIWEGGLASHGATIGILLALYLFSKKKQFDYLWVLDRIVIVVALGGSFIRLGNLMNSEIVGKATDVPWAFLFVRNTEYFPPVPRHPAQLYEAISSFILFLVLYTLWEGKKDKTPRGFLFGLFLVILFSLRFIYEFLKENQVSFEDKIPLNMGQWLSIPLVLAGVYFLINSLRDKRFKEASIQ